MPVRITVGDWGGDYQVASGREAIKAFFRDILSGKIKLCQLSPIGTWTDGKEPIAFRIGPALFKAGKLSADELAASFRACGLEFKTEEIAAMVAADSWMVDK